MVNSVFNFNFDSKEEKIKKEKNGNQCDFKFTFRKEEKI